MWQIGSLCRAWFLRRSYLFLKVFSSVRLDTRIETIRAVGHRYDRPETSVAIRRSKLSRQKCLNLAYQRVRSVESISH